MTGHRKAGLEQYLMTACKFRTRVHKRIVSIHSFFDVRNHSKPLPFIKRLTGCERPLSRTPTRKDIMFKKLALAAVLTLGGISLAAAHPGPVKGPGGGPIKFPGGPIKLPGGPGFGGPHFGPHGFAGPRFWHGRYWAYGIGPCWAPSPAGFVWVCY
jgi:hypothetical protein